MQFKIATIIAFVCSALAAPTTVVTGPCEGSGSVCHGEASHYDGGLGACGWNANSKTDDIIALPHALMGQQSNGNPYCGRTVTISSVSVSVQAKVVDKCMGCEGYKIDMSDKVFERFQDLETGIIEDIAWYFD